MAFSTHTRLATVCNRTTARAGKFKSSYYIDCKSIGAHSSKGLGGEACTKFMMCGTTILRVEPERPLDEGTEWIVGRIGGPKVFCGLWLNRGLIPEIFTPGIICSLPTHCNV